MKPSQTLKIATNPWRLLIQRDETFSDLENRYKSLEALNAQRDETFSDLENRFKSLEALNV